MRIWDKLYLVWQNLSSNNPIFCYPHLVWILRFTTYKLLLISHIANGCNHHRRVIVHCGCCKSRHSLYTQTHHIHIYISNFEEAYHLQQQESRNVIRLTDDESIGDDHDLSPFSLATSSSSKEVCHTNTQTHTHTHASLTSILVWFEYFNLQHRMPRLCSCGALILVANEVL